MRHQLRTDIEIEATPAAVWAILTDLERYEQWNPFIVSASGVVAAGERLRNRMEPPGGRAMTFRPRVTVVEPERVFEWRGRLGVPWVFDGTHRFELEATNRGTRLIQSEAFRGLLVPFLRGALDTQTRAGFDAMNAALKARAEAQAAPRSEADAPPRSETHAGQGIAGASIGLDPKVGV